MTTLEVIFFGGGAGGACVQVNPLGISLGALVDILPLIVQARY
jgi:hypothetical protein